MNLCDYEKVEGGKVDEVDDDLAWQVIMIVSVCHDQNNDNKKVIWKEKKNNCNL